MEISTIPDARAQLPELIDRALAGEEIVIGREGAPLVRLVPIEASEAPREGGQWKGRVRIADDFDALPDDLADAFGKDGE